MICKFKEQLEKYSMLCEGDRVIAAFSGGADSTAMLHMLCAVRDEYGFTLRAAHVNHMLRGENSDADERFVRDFCEKHSIKLDVLKVDIKALAEQRNEGTEECGRNVRYEFFRSLDPGAKIATAHTLSDNLETVLFNLTRGSSLNGLRGIPPVRDNIIRPVLCFSRSEIEQYCAENSLNYVTDASNFSDEYNRNKLRLSVVPVLKEINPSVEAALGRCVQTLYDDEEYLEKKTDELIDSITVDGGYSAKSLLDAPAALRTRAIRRLLFGKTNGKPQKYHVDLAEKLLSHGGAAELSDNYTMFCGDGLLYFKKKTDQTPIKPWNAAFKTGVIELPFAAIKSEIIYKNKSVCTQKIHKELLENCLDYDKLYGEAVFRSREPSDRITQCAGSCTKSLKKLFNEKMIPVSERAGVVILSDEKGLAWLEGYGCDRRCAIDENTERILKIVIDRH